ncbi:MAG: hypothetical protein KIC54_03650 [Clostridium sp.]|nr:hypothetical protein [Clostridium sp.]
MEEVLKEQIKNDIAKIVKILKEIDLNLKDNVALNEKNVEIHINPDCKLEDGKMGIYMFCYRYKDKEVFLKIGKAGEKTKARFSTQHYCINKTKSTLAKSLIKSIQEDRIDNEVLEKIKQEIAVIITQKEMKQILDHSDACNLKKTKENIKAWMKHNLTKINIVLDANLGNRVLSFFEEYFLFKYNPIFEGKLIKT